MGVIHTAFLILLLVVQQMRQVDCKTQKLLLLLLDGIRWDYLDYDGLGRDGFRRVMREGVRAEYLQADFPTKSYTNYYSIMTGLHAESHGMVGNYMYDSVRDEYFLIGTNPEQLNAHWWDDGDPLWITAVRQEKKSYLYYWLGCEVEIRGLRPTYCRNYTGVPSLEDTRSALQDGLTQLENNQADVVGVYYELGDKTGHYGGPYSDRVKTILRQIDQQIAYILTELDRRGLQDDVNLMMFSDHGMTAVSPSRTIDLSQRLDTDVKVYLEGGSILFIWPEEGKLDMVYRRLVNFHPNMTVFFKDNIPEKWHFKKGRLTPPILAVADMGWLMLTPRSPHYPADADTMEPLKGDHGFDNTHPDMRGVFAAVGPAFRRNYVSKPLRVVDLYQVMCAILDITPSTNNGTWDRVNDMMDAAYSSSGHRVSQTFIQYYILILLAVYFTKTVPVIP